VLETAGGSAPRSSAQSRAPKSHEQHTPPVRSRSRPTLLALIPTALKAMRKELRRGSPVTRHATRVSAVAAAGYILGSGLPLGHGYWAPLTSVMVMRPDFSQTYSRAVARLGGTVVGVAVATAVVRLADPGTYLSGTLAVVSAALMYLLMRTGQFAAQGCIAAYVVFLLGMGGEQWTQTVPERVLLTLLGGLLAMLAYAVYPAWETPRLRTRLADWLATQGRYAAVVFDAYADPTLRNAPDVREALLTARTARASWHTAVARATAEPVRHRGLSRTAADDAEDALAQLGRVAMLLEAHLPERGATPVPTAARFAEALRESTHQGAKAIRERRVPTWDAVRAALEAWETWEAEKGGKGGEPGAAEESGGTRAAGEAGAVRETGATGESGRTGETRAPGAPEAAGESGETRAVGEIDEPGETGEPGVIREAEATSQAPGAPETPAAPEPAAPDNAKPATPGNDKFVRDAARLVLHALTELSEALDTAVPPMTLDGTAAAEPTPTSPPTPTPTSTRGADDDGVGVRNPDSP